MPNEEIAYWAFSNKSLTDVEWHQPPCSPVDFWKFIRKSRKDRFVRPTDLTEVSPTPARSQHKQSNHKPEEVQKNIEAAAETVKQAGISLELGLAPHLRHILQSA